MLLTLAIIDVSVGALLETERGYICMAERRGGRGERRGVFQKHTYRAFPGDVLLMTGADGLVIGKGFE